MIVTNAAADAAGGVMLDDSNDVRLIDNTVAQNITTATSDSGPVFAFDMYPEGAPLGNKYQSIQVNFNAR